MRIAVVQHMLGPDAEKDAETLLSAVAAAAANDADLIVLPEVRSVHEGPALEEWWQRAAIAAPESGILVPHVGPAPENAAFEARMDPLGMIAMLSGDAVMDEDVLRETALRGPDVIILGPHSESELQAEAVTEFAIELSLSIAPLVIVAEQYGAGPGEPGHGGSAIVYLGEVVGEAVDGADILYADLDPPLAPPEPRAPIPHVAPILEQRLATHRGRKLDVPYPADLS